jgi:hypothetical protein
MASGSLFMASDCLDLDRQKSLDLEQFGVQD